MKDVSEKRKKFQENARRRTQNAIEFIDKIGALNNKKTYEWEENDIAKMVKALKNSVSNMEKKFIEKTAKTDTFDF